MMEAYSLDAVDMAKANFDEGLDFSEASVEKVEKIMRQFYDSLPRGFFQKLFKRPPPPETIDQVCKMFGAYIGEVLRRRFGGEWMFDEKTFPGTRIISLQRDGMRIWPTAKIHKRITNGAEDNVWHYFKILNEEWGRPVAAK